MSLIRLNQIQEPSKLRTFESFVPSSPTKTMDPGWRRGRLHSCNGRALSTDNLQI
jgi:hypothetical protein